MPTKHGIYYEVSASIGVPHVFGTYQGGHKVFKISSAVTGITEQ
jgi:hypothetical protein